MRLPWAEDLAEFITYIALCCEYALNLHLKAARGEDIEEAEDIDKEIALFKRSLQKSTGDIIEAREYATQVLYPFSLYFQDKLEQFSGLFRSINTSVDSSVKEVDNQISTFDLLRSEFHKDREIRKEIRKDWPEDAASIVSHFRSALIGFQGEKGYFDLSIENVVDSNGCVWNFSADKDLYNNIYKKEYKGRDLKELKKIFNEMIRSTMKTLLENPSGKKLGDEDG